MQPLAQRLLGEFAQDRCLARLGPGVRRVDLAEAETLLRDARHYSSADEIAADLERVYYVNVENIAG